MKNIHILPTDKLSRLVKIKNNLFYTTTKNIPGGVYQNIYITSDEEIKEGDWFALDMSHSSTLPDEIHQMGSDNWSKTGGIHFCEGNSWIKSCKKIILTTDEQLIKDGVQPIPDDFLQWFVKNPSCEEVEVFHQDVYSMGKWNRRYGIIISKEIDILELGQVIPKEKSKQETLEEAAEKYDENDPNDEYGKSYRAFIEGAKWQQERTYSEEEVKNLIKIIEWYDKESDVRPNYTPDIEERIGEISMWDWFEQFKKK